MIFSPGEGIPRKYRGLELKKVPGEGGGSRDTRLFCSRDPAVIFNITVIIRFCYSETKFLVYQ